MHLFQISDQLPSPVTPEKFSQQITQCQKCKRLRSYCLKIAREKRRAYLNDTYFGKPISPFGDPKAQLLIVGLAPAAHGANRTGRVFTGDRSGEWLYRALHAADFSNSAESIGPGKDHLKLFNTRITCVVKCAPPDNKPSHQETKNCAESFFSREFGEFLAQPKEKVLLVLGQFAFKETLAQFKAQGIPLPKSPSAKFKHGAEFKISLPNTSQSLTLLCSYHPSQQNTFTGKLTQPMFQSVIDRAKSILN